MPRACSDCQLCCRLLPVKAMRKGANARCVHQRYRKGCAVYEHLPTVSPECVAWSCRWLVDPDVPGFNIRRPDHSHYVIDIVPDSVTSVDAEGVETLHIAVQVWVDPEFPDAHRDPALRAYLAMLGALNGMVAVVRYSAMDAFLLVPPALNGGEWLERQMDGMRTGKPALISALERGDVVLSLGPSRGTGSRAISGTARPPAEGASTGHHS